MISWSSLTSGSMDEGGDSVNQPTGNPYVGPRPFSEDEWERFFGRERQAVDLLSLVLADRLMLFFAPSGAGKSSLINARLRRDLEKRRFDVLPTARVSGEVPASVGQVDNIFIFDLISDLQPEQGDLSPFAHLTLSDYLRMYRPPQRDETRDRLRPQVLIVDQFEEVFTSHPEAWDQRGAFFEQLRQAVEDEDSVLRVMLVMREEKVAALERYAHLLPSRLSTRFYMQRLDRNAALKAIERPAEEAGRPFAPEVARDLRDNLSLVWARDHERRQYPGEFVEPVQLQVVCWQLWEELRKYPGERIERQHLEQIAGSGNLAQFVDSALARFYVDAIRATAAKTGVSEYRLRYWFEESLITEDRTRNQVYRGQDDTEGLQNDAVEALSARLLIHEEPRPAGTWYELVHDRLIGPIWDDNAAWREHNEIVPLVRKWELSHKRPENLIGGALLTKAEKEDWGSLGEEVQAFITASRDEEARREQEAREALEKRERERERELKLAHAQERADQAEAHRLRERRLRHVIGALAFVAIIAAVLAWINWRNAETDRAVVNYELAHENLSDGYLLDGIDHLIIAVHSPALAFLPAVPQHLEMLRDIVVSATGYGTMLDGPPDGASTIEADPSLVTVSPDGQWVVLPVNAAQDIDRCGAYLWRWWPGELDWPAGAECITFRSNPVSIVAFSTDSRWLGLGHANGTVELVNMADRSTAVLYRTGAARLVALAIENSPGQPVQVVVAMDDGVVARYGWHPEQASWQDMERIELQDGLAKVMALCPDGNWIAVVDESGVLRVMDTAGRTEGEAVLKTTGEPPLAWSVDGRWLAVANQDTVQIWGLQTSRVELATELPAAPGEHPPPVRALAFAVPRTPGEIKPALLAVGYWEGTIGLYSIPQVLGEQPAEPAVLEIPTPTGGVLENEDGLGALAGLDLLPTHLRVPGGEALAHLAFGGADGQSLAAVFESKVEIWQGASMMEATAVTEPDTNLFSMSPPFSSVVIGMDDRSWLVTDKQGKVRAFEFLELPQTGREKKQFLSKACEAMQTAGDGGGFASGEICSRYLPRSSEK
jgi:WD40 repeat protein